MALDLVSSCRREAASESGSGRICGFFLPVLAAVFDRIKRAGINVQETDNVVFDGAKAAVARIHLNQAPSDEILREIESSTKDILEVTLLPI